MTGQPLDEWFSVKFNGVEGEFGDDISGFEITRLTLLEALSAFKKIKFSHLLIGLAAYEHGLKNGTLQVEHIWDEGQYQKAYAHLIEEAQRLLGIMGMDA
ncbi:MAG: hypothetical protein ACRCXC_11150 [Legionella sp.]